MAFELFNNGYLRHPHQNHNPCYRKILSYSMYRSFQFKNDIEIVKAEFLEMINRFDQRKIFLIDHFLEMYPTNMAIDKESLGYVIVDSTRDGCFPLVIRPDSHLVFNGIKNKSRISGLVQAIDDLGHKKSKILSIINTRDAWDIVEPKLERIFNYRRPANDQLFPPDIQTG